MKITEALSICLISFFSATLVMLIARSMDSQAANRIEPHLLRIADQLESLQAAGGLSAIGARQPSSAVLTDGVVVHYFYGSTRCVTCESIQTQAEATLQEHFKRELEAGELGWRTLNYEDSRNADLTKIFEVMMPVVVVTRYASGELKEWKRLDEVWGLVGKKSKFAQLIQDNVSQMLAQVDRRSAEVGAELEPNLNGSVHSIPLPRSDAIPLPINEFNSISEQ